MFDAVRHQVASALTRKMFSVQPRVRRLLVDPATVEDPYPLYAELLAEGAVVQDRLTTVAVGFDAVQAVLRDPRFGHPDPDRPRTRMERLLAPDHYRGLVHPIAPPSMISVNPPAHTRYRRLVTRAFT